ncbi:ATP-binding protein, partial [Patescibacteria group bacterium]
MAIKKAEKATKKPNKKEKKGSYGAESISVLEGLEPVRKRPGMYIGTTGPEGLHHMIWEIFDNGRDEAMGGFADHIEVALLPNNRIRVADNGRGIPVDIHKKTKVSALETIMTTLHAGGKFGGDGYAKATGGLHGVGASVVNALSEYTKVEVHRDGGKHMQEYSKGKKKAKVKKVGASKLHGTIVTFEADDTIFEEVKFNADKIINHLRQQAYLIKGSRVSVIDAREYTGKIDADNAFYLMELGLEVPSKTFYFEGGLLSLVKHFNENQKAIHKHVFYTDKESGEVSVEVAFQYVDDISPRLVTFANNTSTPEVEHLKRYYSLLQIKDYLLMKKIGEKCNQDSVFILYLYSNKGDCEDCQREGYVLTYLREQYPDLQIYAFDYNLDVSAIRSLASLYSIENNLPAMVINDELYYGFKSKEEVEELLPESIKKLVDKEEIGEEDVEIVE